MLFLLFVIASEHINISNSGKSCFLFFTLLHRLCNGKPTTLQISNSILGFEKDGVTEYDTLIVNPNVLPKGTWALVDTEDPETLPCATFLAASRERLALIVQAASPQTSHFTSWIAGGCAFPYAMDAFSTLKFISLGSVQPT
jgi:hypothetical protein